MEMQGFNDKIVHDNGDRTAAAKAIETLTP